VPYGYILIYPVSEILRVVSTILFLWGTYRIVWRELQSRFDSEKDRWLWWLAAKVTIFIVTGVASFYLILYLGLAIAWLQFLSLNATADIASRRTQFEVAMTAMFSGFALLTTVAATATLIFKALEQSGGIKNVSSLH
jgi:hypothetical protein